ncbi:hypothetical protein DXG01_011432, partial [Tephrocybe rancida]
MSCSPTAGHISTPMLTRRHPDARPATSAPQRRRNDTPTHASPATSVPQKERDSAPPAHAPNAHLMLAPATRQRTHLPTAPCSDVGTTPRASAPNTQDNGNTHLRPPLTACRTPHRPPTATSVTNTQHNGDDTDRPHCHISAHNPMRWGHAPLPTARWPPDSPPPTPSPSAWRCG